LSDHRPDWLKKRLSLDNNVIKEVKSLIEESNLHTVCQSANCPNIFECFSKRSATFLLMGDRCSRNCAFCSIDSKKTLPLDENEPVNIGITASKMGLRYVVLTSVTRDDIADGGAQHFSLTVKEIKKRIPGCLIECLIPDFGGNKESLRTIVSQPISVLNHNIETIERNYSKIRPGADYRASLEILKEAKKIKKGLYTKSGFMVGLGETMDEVGLLLKDLHEVDCDMVTIGQYLSPTRNNINVTKYYSNEEFEELRELAEMAGIKNVISGAFVRSSYKASLLLKKAAEGK